MDGVGESAQSLRQMLQLDLLGYQPSHFTWQAIIKSVSLVSEANWQRINKIIIELGYTVMAPSEEESEQVS